MAIPTLSGSYIDETYVRLVQVSGSEFADGLGNPISFGNGTLSGGINGYIPVWSGSTSLSNSIISQTDNSLNISGTLSVQNGVTASLYGTASWAYNVVNAPTIDTSSFATTNSNNFNGSQTITGSLSITGSFEIEETKTVFKKVTISNTGLTELVANDTGSYSAALGKYTINNGVNTRAGEFMTAWNGSQIVTTDTSTTDIGSTTAVAFTSSLSAGQIIISVNAQTTGWNIKMLTTYI